MTMSSTHLSTLPDRLCKSIDISSDKVHVIYDLVDIKAKWNLWQQSIPFVKPFYAVKCLTFSAMLHHLNELGAHFDCATKGEVELCLKNNVNPQRILFANPQKFPSHMQYAYEQGVEQSVFDSELELEKHLKYWPNARLLLRVDGKRFDAKYSLSGKFGVPLSEVERFLCLAKKMNFIVEGFSFHVGCQCLDREAFKYYISQCILMIRVMREKFHDVHYLHVVNIGGGFPGGWHEADLMQFQSISTAIQETMKETKICDSFALWAEPGRFFAESVSHFAFKVILQSFINDENDQEIPCYHVNASYRPYGFMQILDHGCLLQVPPAFLLRNNNIIPFNQLLGLKIPSKIVGNFRQNGDVFNNLLSCPPLEYGDWLIYTHFGAYTYGFSSKHEDEVQIHVVE